MVFPQTKITSKFKSVFRVDSPFLELSRKPKEKLHIASLLGANKEVSYGCTAAQAGLNYTKFAQVMVCKPSKHQIEVS